MTINRVDRIVLDPDRTYACTRTARTGDRVTMPIKPLAKTKETKLLSAVQSEDKPTCATRSKTSKTTLAIAKKPATASTKAAATSNRKRKTEEADTTFEQQRTPQALTTSLINM